jgi:hypothetical protein
MKQQQQLLRSELPISGVLFALFAIERLLGKQPQESEQVVSLETIREDLATEKR